MNPRQRLIIFQRIDICSDPVTHPSDLRRVRCSLLQIGGCSHGQDAVGDGEAARDIDRVGGVRLSHKGEGPAQDEVTSRKPGNK